MKKKVSMIICMAIAIVLSGCSSAYTAAPVSNSGEDDGLSKQLTDLQASIDEYNSRNSDNGETISIPLEDIGTEMTEIEGNIILSVTNNTDHTYSSICPTIIYYDKDNNMLSYSTLYMGYVFPKTTYMTSIGVPLDVNNVSIVYDHYEIMYTGTIEEQEMKNYADQVEVTSNIGADGNIIAKCYNHSGVNLPFVEAYTIFYKDNKMVGVSQNTFGEIIPDSYALTEFYFPSYTITENAPPAFDDYKIVVTSASKAQNGNGYYE